MKTNGQSILLVEDNDDDVFLMRRALKDAKLDNIPMQVVTDGQEALDYLQGVGKFGDRGAHPLPSVMFLDLKLPYVHGFEVLSWIRGESPIKELPVLVLTSSPEERDRRKAEELGAKAYLVKPPTGAMIREAMASLSGVLP